MRKLILAATGAAAATAAAIASTTNTASAACSWTDPIACADGAMYTAAYAYVASLWTIDSAILIAAWQLDSYRAYLVNTAFLGIYNAITAYISPIFLPAAIVMLMLAAILMMILPAIGVESPIKIRSALLWAIVGPMLLAIGGQAIGGAEQIRSEVASEFFADGLTMMPTGIFGATSASLMPVPTAIYPAACGAQSLVRPNGGTGLRADDVAAAIVRADALDIHCPDARGPVADLPDGMFIAEPTTWMYFGDVADLTTSAERQSYIVGARHAAQATQQSIIVAVLAVMLAMIDLIFALAAVLVWLALPFAILAGYFVGSAAPVKQLAAVGWSVIQTSWTSSIVAGLLTAVVVGTSTTANPIAIVGSSILGILLALVILIIACTTIVRAAAGVNTAVTAVAGMGIGTVAQGVGTVIGGVTAAGLLIGSAGNIRDAIAGKKTGKREVGMLRTDDAGDAGGVNAVGRAMGGVVPSEQAEQGQTLTGAFAEARPVAGGVAVAATYAERQTRRSELHGELVRARASGDMDAIEQIHTELGAINTADARDADLRRPAPAYRPASQEVIDGSYTVMQAPQAITASTIRQLPAPAQAEQAQVVQAEQTSAPVQADQQPQHQVVTVEQAKADQQPTQPQIVTTDAAPAQGRAEQSEVVQVIQQEVSAPAQAEQAQVVTVQQEAPQAKADQQPAQVVTVQQEASAPAQAEQAQVVTVQQEASAPAQAEQAQVVTVQQQEAPQAKADQQPAQVVQVIQQAQGEQTTPPHSATAPQAATTQPASSTASQPAPAPAPAPTTPATPTRAEVTRSKLDDFWQVEQPKTEQAEDK